MRHKQIKQKINIVLCVTSSNGNSTIHWMRSSLNLEIWVDVKNALSTYSLHASWNLKKTCKLYGCPAYASDACIVGFAPNCEFSCWQNDVDWCTSSLYSWTGNLKLLNNTVNIQLVCYITDTYINLLVNLYLIKKA